MAKQHFYSRVPFRVSMFNKADSFDTFACSSGLDRAFIEKELAAVCERKPTAEEADLIRENKLLPVYCSYFTKEGQLIQSCTSFIPSDYTGERSAYLVHSLIYDAGEQARLIRSPDNALLNPGAFVRDIGTFDITGPDAQPDDQYPEQSLAPAPAPMPMELLAQYNEKMLRYLIFSLLDCVCGKTKALYFSLPGEEDPGKILDFFNAALQILPYHIREKLSFVSGVSDAAAMNGFKVKYMRKTGEEVPVSKGIYLRFTSNLVTGLKEDHFNAQSHLIDFFWELLSKEPVRREFLAFSSHIVEQIPSLGAATMQALRDLVFLFCCCSDFYSQNTVLPNDDAVLSFLNIYEKSRQSLNNEYRIRAVKCLQRYPEHHMEIPKKIFAKMTKLYPTEPGCVRYILLNVVLELIHTDIMRNKLYTFIKNNYPKEEPETRQIILENLSRVYYGGFLQSQILAMFDENFSEMSDVSKTVVLEKVMLTLRTKSIQDKIMEFLEVHFSEMSPENRETVYAEAVVHLAEGDDLARKLLHFADQHLPQEPEETQSRLLQQVLDAVEAEQHKTRHPMLQLLSSETGICSKALLYRLLSAWYNRKIFSEYAALACEHSMGAFIESCVQVLNQLPETSGEVLKKLRQVLENVSEAPQKQTDIYGTLRFMQTLSQLQTQADDPTLAEFYGDLLNRAVLPAVENSMLAVFSKPEQKNGVESVVEIARGHEKLRSCPQFQVLTEYLKLKKAALDGNITLFFAAYVPLSHTAGWKRPISRYLRQDLLKSEILPTPLMRNLTDFAVKALQGEPYSFVGLYDSTAEAAMPDAEEPEESEKKSKGRKKAAVPDNTDAKKQGLEAALAVANAIYASGDPELTQMLRSEDCDLSEVLSSFIADVRKGAGILKKVLQELQPPCPDFSRFCGELQSARKTAKRKPKGGGLLGKLFHR